MLLHEIQEVVFSLNHLDQCSFTLGLAMNERSSAFLT